MIRQHLSSKSLVILTTALFLNACGGQDTAAPEPAEAKLPATAAPAVTTQAPTVTPTSAEMLIERGAKLYKRCQTCHTLDEGGKHKVGPNMWGLYGSTTGQKDGFAYSKAMSESGLVWTDETLNAYIENPRKYMPGNRMSYVGLRKPEDREAVLAYIKAQTTPK